MSWIDIYETPPFIVFLQVQSPSDFSRVLTGTQRSAPVPRPKPSAPTGTPWTPMALPAISSGNYSIICLDSIMLTPCSDKGRRIGLMLKIFVWKKVVYSNNFSFALLLMQYMKSPNTLNCESQATLALLGSRATASGRQL